MFFYNEVEGQIESQDEIFSGNSVREASQIEELMNRAHEIHRANGGLIGYDLEDWLQAERELIERDQSDLFQMEVSAPIKPLSFDRERNRRKCLGPKD
ncbi:MAG TPA: DUF2934 domain-containing protein [Candidatus Acidoferrales bacterium]|jgi:hypothetical protein|nr:DUF2934 domain-containing protein [Candidatus Acidoferrales bacterium]